MAHRLVISGTQIDFAQEHEAALIAAARVLGFRTPESFSRLKEAIEAYFAEWETIYKEMTADMASAIKAVTP